MALPVTTVLILVKEQLTYYIHWNKQSFNCFLETGYSAIIDLKDFQVVSTPKFRLLDKARHGECTIPSCISRALRDLV